VFGAWGCEAVSVCKWDCGFLRALLDWKLLFVIDDYYVVCLSGVIRSKTVSMTVDPQACNDSQCSSSDRWTLPDATHRHSQ
jgi:hypothetical protein